MLKGGNFTVKAKKLIAMAVLGLMVFTGVSYAAKPEDALSSRPDDSVYFVLRLGDTARFLQWLMSSEHIKLVMPLIIGSKESNEIMGTVEVLSAIIQHTPLKSAALVIGINKADVQVKAPFFQMAFDVDHTVSYVVRKVVEGVADAKDVAKLLLGDNSPLAAFAETMIKVERGEDKTLKINNTVFMKASDGLVIIGTSRNDITSALKALEDSTARLFGERVRRFTTDDFALVHVDYATAQALDTDNTADIDGAKYFDKPLEIEFAFRRFTDKFLMSAGLNLKNALKQRYADRVFGEKTNTAKGGNINLKNAGGKKTPLAAFGSYFDPEKVLDKKEVKDQWDKAVRQVQKRFGITEDDIKGVFNGPFSVVVNDSVPFEGFKIPAVYISQTGAEGAAGQLYGKLTKSPHFTSVKNGILQLDSSISPISCLVAEDGDTLAVDFAELSSLSETPELNPALASLMEQDATTALWVNFAGIQAWLLDDTNGVFQTITPLATFMGYSKYVKALRDVLSAEFSVPSVSFWAESQEVYNAEFAIAEIDPENGLLARLIKVYMELNKNKK